MEFWDVVLALMVLFALVGASYCYYDFKTGVSTFPTMPAVRRKMIEILQQDFAAKQPLDPGRVYTIIDLGSGSGQLCGRVARVMPQARVLGIEISPVPWLRSVIRQRLFGPANLSYQRLDFWPYDVSGVDAVLCYLPGTIMGKVAAKLRKELRPGSIMISNRFRTDEWEPVETHTVHTPFKTDVLVYRQR